MKRFAKMTYLICMIFFVFATAVNAAGAQQELKTERLSYGMEIIKSKLSMTKTAQRGRDVIFTREDFFEATGRRDIRYVTVTKLPEGDEGCLKWGALDCFVGQEVPLWGLDLIRYIPNNGKSEQSTFTFTVDRDEILECTVYHLTGENLAPVASRGEVIGVKNTPLYGLMDVCDPEGDDYTVEIVKYPKNGTLCILSGGLYCYTPDRGFTGQDSFTFTALDKYGKSSQKAVCTVKINDGANISYADMENSYAVSGAVMLADAGLMTGNCLAGRYKFDPHGEISVLDFTVLTMKALGISPVLPASQEMKVTDRSVTDEENMYLSYAKALGAFSGLNVEILNDCTRAITENEARDILQALADAAGCGEKAGYITNFASIVGILEWEIDASVENQSKTLLDREAAAFIISGIMK